MWPALTANIPSERNEILHNIDDIWGSASLTVGQWKLLKGTNYKGFWDRWFGPAGDRLSSSYDVNLVMQCESGKALTRLKMMPEINEIRSLRVLANVDCDANNSNRTEPIVCKPLEQPCLFNVYDDPCEQFNLADE